MKISHETDGNVITETLTFRGCDYVRKWRPKGGLWKVSGQSFSAQLEADGYEDEELLRAVDETALAIADLNLMETAKKYEIPVADPGGWC